MRAGLAGGLIEYAILIAKTVGLYGLALALFRLMGKRCLGDMEPLDFVVVIAIAEIVGAPLADPDLPIAPAVVAITTLTLVQIGLAWVSTKSPPVQRLLEGNPVVVIEGGRVLQDNLRRAKVSVAELTERLRERGFLGPQDVELAVLETDGMLSAIPKREAAPVTPRFLGRRASTALLVMGKPDREALKKAGLSVGELEDALRRRGLRFEDAEEVIRDPRGRLHVTLHLTQDPRRHKPEGST